jgi:hypothetical protein
MTDAPLEASPHAGPARRRLLGALAGLPFTGWAWRSFAAAPVSQALLGQNAPPNNLAVPFPSDITAVVAGQQGGNTDTWAQAVLAALAQNLPAGTRVHSQPAGAADGVTGANQFETRTGPDGARVLVVPGAAALAWLAGDPRAQFDVGHWVPVIAGVSPGVVALRGGRAGLAPGRKVRIATASPIGPELAALLGVDLLGAQPVPVTGLMNDAAVRTALAQGNVDGVLLRGRKVVDQVASMAAFGVMPAYSLGVTTDNGLTARDPQFPELPEFSELLKAFRPQSLSAPLFDGWRAIAAATRLEFAVVLPQLTPAAMVAQWRRAGTEATATPELARATAEQMVRTLGGAAGAAEVTAVTADSGTLLELRRWLGARLDWHPS